MAAAGPGFPRLALGLAWICSSLAAGAFGWFLSTTSSRGNTVLGRALLGLAVVGLVAAGAVASNRRRALTLMFSVLASAAFVLAGIAAVILALTRGGARASSLLVAAAILAGGGLISGPLGHCARSMSKPWH